MYGLKRESYKLRCKGFNGFSDPRPGIHSADNCLVCGRYMEHLNYQGLCQTDECRDLLARMCIEGNIGLKTKEGADTWIIIKPAKLLEARQELLELSENTPPVDEMAEHQCGCGRAMKMPHRDICAVCYRASNLVSGRKKRAEVKAIRKDRSNKNRQSQHRSQYQSQVSNKIRGLEKLVKSR